MPRIPPRLASSLCAVLLLLPAIAFAQARPATAACAALPPELSPFEIGEGRQQGTRLGVRIQRMAIGNPEVADVALAGNDGFLVTGKRVGETTLFVWTACSAEPLATLVRVEGESTWGVREQTGARQMESFRDLPNQVQTDIRFVEVSRTKLQEAGFSIFGRNSGNRQFLFGSPGASAGVTVTPGAVAGSAMPSIPLVESGFNIVWGGGSSRVLGMLNALEGSGFAYTLAQPSLVAMSGTSASFLAGGEFPVPVPNNNGDNVTIEYKEFGIRLTLTPTVIDRHRIALKVAPEVSELDYSAGIRTAGIAVPALRVRRTDTSVTLADGESFVISGLVSTNTLSQIDKLPGLGSLPVLGALFRSSRLASDDRELLMIVTPRLVQPLAASAELPELPGEQYRSYRPNFFEFYFLEGGDFGDRSQASSGLSY